MSYSNIISQQVTATGRQITAKWTRELEAIVGTKPMQVSNGGRKGFKYQIKISHHLKWPEVAAWLEHSFGPGGNRKSWSCDWGTLYTSGKARDEFKFRISHSFNVYLTTDEQLSHFLLTWKQ